MSRIDRMSRKRLVGLTLAGIVAPLILSACATPSGFHWGDYEDRLYAYAKSPDQRDRYVEALEKAIARGLEQDRLAPGLMAELGYLHLEAGAAQEAVAWFQREMEHFPESRALLSNIVSGLTGAPSATAPDNRYGAVS